MRTLDEDLFRIRTRKYRVKAGADISIYDLAQTFFDVVGSVGAIATEGLKTDGDIRKMTSNEKIDRMRWMSVNSKGNLNR